jgi:D-glycero-alpha-D-manno-heptose-7-phosphate kinase
MIVTRTPLRISFAGGGTDFADFYTEHTGQVVSSAIDKYIYVIIKERFDDKIRLGYSRTEMVDSVDELEHELVREAMRITGVKSGVEISTMADIPSEGSGLGSSSSVTVGVLHALHAYMGDLVTAEQLAQEACRIEIDILGKPIGKQDQYIAAYGGLRSFVFEKDGGVTQRPLNLSPERRNRLGESLMLFFTGVTRKSDAILAEQKANIAERADALLAMRDQAAYLCELVTNGGSLMRMGRVMHSGWEMKSSLATGVSAPEIDALYEKALDAGAIGGKVAGAGGGGFLLLLCPPDRQQSVRSALSHLRELEFSLERDGSKVVMNGR